MDPQGRPVYLDNNATTPLHPEVAQAMQPFLGAVFGNPSSDHAYGRAAQRAVSEARDEVAALLGCHADEVVFTGGGSEADVLALKGVAGMWRRERGGPGRLVVSAVEHPAVEQTAVALEREGWEVDVLPVDAHGRVDPDTVAAALRDDTALVSVMHANNETGTINPIAAVSEVCRERGVLLHSDAAQSVGKVPADVGGLGVDLLTVAGHKLHGPKGVGALFVRRGVALEPVIPGGGQEGGRRAGTENLLGIAGLGAAAALARERGLADFQGRVRGLRDRLHERLAEGVPGLLLNGHPEDRLPNTLNVSLPGVRGGDVLAAAPAVAAGTGSACHEGESRPSAVLIAMGRPSEVALGAVRLSLGLLNDEDDVDVAADALIAGYEEAGPEEVLRR